MSLSESVRLDLGQGLNLSLSLCVGLSVSVESNSLGSLRRHDEENASEDAQQNTLWVHGVLIYFFVMYCYYKQQIQSVEFQIQIHFKRNNKSSLVTYFSNLRCVF